MPQPDTNTQPPQPSEWEHDLTDAANNDPGVTDAVRAAGCSIDSELRTLEAQTQ